MLRLAVLLVLTGACDKVFAIEAPAPAACGPFGEPVPLVFAESISDPHGFSTRSDQAIGAVTATVGGQTHLYVVAQIDGVWTPTEPARNAGLADVLQGAIADPDCFGVEELLGAVGSTRQALLYGFSTAWSPDSGNPVMRDSEFDVTAGNLVEVVDLVDEELVPQRKRAVVVKSPTDGIGKNVLLFVDLLFPYADNIWDEQPERTRPINDDRSISPSSGVLTSDLFTLVYAARRDGGGSDLFVSRRDEVDKNWYPGVQLIGVNTDADELSPWINADCSTIYFERDGVTYAANRVDD
ncbi:MAG: hypothetical protein H0T89_27090 [Deltaproteobacteria bacterium]|nr:hypothetical protein [Deltaproteobacteria bacterium]MDQ3299582.1 hypothetical protein [Myxococcota bacterium]